MRQVTQERNSIDIGALQVAIAVCTLATAFIHLYGVILPGEDFRFWLLFNGSAYLVLLAAFFMPRFASRHHMISFLLMGYAVLTIVLWFVLGQPDGIVGYVTNAIELVLAVLALCEGWRTVLVRSTISYSQ